MKEPRGCLAAALQSASAAAVMAFLSTASVAQTTNVDVVNTPSVRVANPVLRVGGSVTVVNPAASPVPVSGSVNATIAGSVDAQGSARAAVSGYCTVANLYPSGTGNCVLASVPAGQILVIESILCRALVPAGVPFNVVILQLQAPAPGAGLQGLNHLLTLTPTPNASFGGNTAYSLVTPIKLYAFGAAANSGAGPTPVSVGVQAGALPPTNENPSLYCSMAGVVEGQ